MRGERPARIINYLGYYRNGSADEVAPGIFRVYWDLDWRDPFYRKARGYTVDGNPIVSVDDEDLGPIEAT